MANAFIGDIKLVAFNFAPWNWALCNGQILAIAQNQPLFSLLGTTYGGDGTSVFALPDLRGRVPLHMGDGYSPGQQAGEAAHTLVLGEIPSHAHSVLGDTTAAANSSPSNAMLAQSVNAAYGPGLDLVMNPAAAGQSGNSEPHPNMPPYLAMNYIICLVGAFPARN